MSGEARGADVRPHFDIRLRLQPSTAFLGILAELAEQFSDWSDGSYDWANQTVDFLHNQIELSAVGAECLRTPLGQQALQDLLQMSLALFSGQYPAVRQYLACDHFLFVIGYPRSGGSYLTKEMLRTVGLDHTRVSEALAHDGFPEIREHWYAPGAGRPYFHLQDSVFQVAEFLVISHLYYRRKSACQSDGSWIIPKKMHKAVYWGGSLKMLLGKGAADYLITLRHPVPTAISIYEKSGGFPADGRFPAQPRSAIERWIADDLAWMGQPAAGRDYFEAVQLSWSAFHTRLAQSGLFLGTQTAEEETRLLPYGQQTMEETVRRYRNRYGSKLPPEPFLIHDKSHSAPIAAREAGDAAVAAQQALWRSLGLSFPTVSSE